jgi:hypothetical protein
MPTLAKETNKLCAYLSRHVGIASEVEVLHVANRAGSVGFRGSQEEVGRGSHIMTAIITGHVTRVWAGRTVACGTVE